MSDRELIKAELQNLQKILEAKADMCIGNGKVKLLSFANACSDALELLKAQPELVHCSECVHCAKSEYAGFWHCEAWDEDVSMGAWNPEEYYCREGERREL